MESQNDQKPATEFDITDALETYNNTSDWGDWSLKDTWKLVAKLVARIRMDQSEIRTRQDPPPGKAYLPGPQDCPCGNNGSSYHRCPDYR